MQSKSIRNICIVIIIILGIIFFINIISQNSHPYVPSPDELHTYEYKDCDAVITKHNGSYILHPVIQNNTDWNALLDESQLGFELQEDEWAKLHADFISLDGGVAGHCGEINFDTIYSHENITLAELINQKLIPEYIRSEYMQYGYYQDGRDFLSVNRKTKLKILKPISTSGVTARQSPQGRVLPFTCKFSCNSESSQELHGESFLAVSYKVSST